jgi:dTDP-4-amino-4,6-dideoxygalactose transaminase
MQALQELARSKNLVIIEDAAQAHGASFHAQRAGTLGIVACFSFYPGKNLGAYGDAGAIVTNDDDLAKRMRMYANHGRLAKYDHEVEGLNSRLDGLQAAILSVKLRYLNSWTERRREIARRYDDAFGDLVAIPRVAPGATHVYHLYVIRVRDRSQVQAKLSEMGVETGIHYPIPLPFLKAYSHLGHRGSDFPISYRLKDEILSLPIHGSMHEREVAYVIDSVRSILVNDRKRWLQA